MEDMRKLNELEHLKSMIDDLIEEDATNSELNAFMLDLDPEKRVKLADYIIAGIQPLLGSSSPLLASIEDIDINEHIQGRCYSSIRELLARQFIEGKQWSKAAHILSGINVLDSRFKYLSDLDKLFRCVQIAHLYLKDNDAVNAEAFINRASGLVQNCSSESSLYLHYLVCNARILDLKRNFLEAASGYYKISKFYMRQIEDTEIKEEEMLTSAVTCTILAAAGHARDVLLKTLYMDERCSKLKIYPILHKMYLRGKLAKRDIDEFAKQLEPHQVTELMKKEVPRRRVSWLGVFVVLTVIVSFAARLASHGGGDVPFTKKRSFASAVTDGFRLPVKDIKRIEESSKGRIHYPGLVSANDERKSKTARLDYATLSLTWARSFILLKKRKNWKDYIESVPDDRFSLHGLWPPNDRKAKGIAFNKNKVFADRPLYHRARKYWPNLNPNNGAQNEDHDAKFWEYEWNEHGDKSGMPQEDFMDCALERFESAHRSVYYQVDLNSIDYYDEDLQLNSWKISVSALERGLFTAFTVKPKLVCISLDGKSILLSIQFNVSLGPPRKFVDMEEPSSCHGTVILT